MNIHQRRLIVITFIAMFLTAAPIVLFYTSGYRYNWQKNKVEQVGVLMLDVKPSDAQLYLNNESQPAKRPLRLANLLPNYYQARAEKEGYYSWQKNLQIKARESTLMYDIVLFKKKIPSLLENGPVTQFGLSPAQSAIVIQKLNALWSLDKKTDEKTLLALLPFSFNQSKIKWAPNGKRFVISDQTSPDFAIINAEKEKVIGWQTFGMGSISQIGWATDSEHLYGLVEAQNRALYEINFQTKTKRKLIEGPIVAYFPVGENIFFVKNFGDKTILYRYHELALPIIEQKIEEIAVLPKSNYRFGDFKNNYLPLLDDASQIFLMNVSNKQDPIIKLKGGATVWGNGEKNNLMYYYDNAEIWIFDPKTRQSNMVIRYSNGIKQVLPVPDKPYFIFLHNDTLRLAELDDRGERNIVTLFEGEDISGTQMDSEGKNIYFIQRNNGNPGLFGLEIQ